MCLTEYATIAYIIKRIQTRKNRFLAIQNIAEQVKDGPSGSLESHILSGDTEQAHKQTVSVVIN